MYIFASLMWLVLIIIVGLMLWFSVWIIDSSFLTVKESEGKVIERYHIQAYAETIYVVSGKVMIPVTTHHNDSYEVVIEINELTDIFFLQQSDWNNINIGDKVYCKHTNGRILNTLRIESIYINKHN
jgi:hypothetical protein